LTEAYPLFTFFGGNIAHPPNAHQSLCFDDAGFWLFLVFGFWFLPHRMCYDEVMHVSFYCLFGSFAALAHAEPVTFTHMADASAGETAATT
jgi:hypothetical protein